jgi:chaperone modulatory protein CbpM
MTTSRYTLRQICEIVGIDESFAGELLQEAILIEDAPQPGGFSALMLERARVAHELVHELDVNLAGAAVIVRMREELTELHRTMRELARELERMGRS